jgi:hypothetical protein
MRARRVILANYRKGKKRGIGIMSTHLSTHLSTISFYWTITCRTALWVRVPEVAVTVIV